MGYIFLDFFYVFNNDFGISNNGILYGYNVGIMGHSYCLQDFADISVHFTLFLNVDVKFQVSLSSFFFCR